MKMWLRAALPPAALTQQRILSASTGSKLTDSLIMTTQSSQLLPYILYNTHHENCTIICHVIRSYPPALHTSWEPCGPLYSSSTSCDPFFPSSPPPRELYDYMPCNTITLVFIIIWTINLVAIKITFLDIWAILGILLSWLNFLVTEHMVPGFSSLSQTKIAVQQYVYV